MSLVCLISLVVAFSSSWSHWRISWVYAYVCVFKFIQLCFTVRNTLTTRWRHISINYLLLLLSRINYGPFKNKFIIGGSSKYIVCVFSGPNLMWGWPWVALKHKSTSFWAPNAALLSAVEATPKRQNAGRLPLHFHESHITHHRHLQGSFYVCHFLSLWFSTFLSFNSLAFQLSINLYLKNIYLIQNYVNYIIN